MRDPAVRGACPGHAALFVDEVMPEHPLRGRVLDVLVDLGLQPNLDNDGDVAFTVNEQQLFVRCTEGEVEIMRVFGQWQIQDEMLTDRVKLHETCNELNLNMNCLKSGIAGSTLVMTSEHLAVPGSDVASLVQVSIQVILSGVHIWHQRLLGIDPNAPEGSPDAGGSPGAGGA